MRISELAPYTLTHADRCDARACGARAYVRAVVSAESDLLFCGHHARDVEAKLRPNVLDWIDETSAIVAKLDVSP